MTVNGAPVPRSEFEYSFNKNNGEGVIDKKSVDEYVDLFINYKLKVAAALDARLDTLTSFKEEFAMYRDQQVRPAMVTDADVLAEARQMYERTKEMIGPKGLGLPAHIFLSLSTKATQAEQDRIKNRIDSVYRVLKAGADFAELARKVSEDKGSAVNAFACYAESSPYRISGKQFDFIPVVIQRKDRQNQFVRSVRTEIDHAEADHALSVPGKSDSLLVSGSDLSLVQVV